MALRVFRILASFLFFLASVFMWKLLPLLPHSRATLKVSEQNLLAGKALLDHLWLPSTLIFVFLGVAILLSPYVISWFGRIRLFSVDSPISDKRFLFSSVTACVGLALLLNTVAFRNYKITPDEKTFINQARIYAQGRLCGTAPPLPEFFEEPYLTFKDGKTFSLFQYGWSFVLTPAVRLGQEQWVPPLTGALTLLVVFLLGRKMSGRGVARGAVLIMLLSPFFLFHTATYYAHIFELLCLCLFALLFYVAREEDRSLCYLWSGVWLALAFLTRYFSLFFGVPFGLLLLWDLLHRREDALKNILFFAVPIFLAGVLALLYQWYLTGDPFLAPYEIYVKEARYLYLLSLLDEPLHIYGFSRVYTPAMGLIRMLKNWMSLNFWIFPLALLFLLPVLIRPRRWELLLLLGCLSLSLGYIPYYLPGGWQYGPRYYLPMLGCLSLLLARGIETGLSIANQRWGKRKGLTAVTGWLFFCLVLNLSVVFAVSWGLRLWVRGLTDIEGVLAKENVREGIVFITIHPHALDYIDQDAAFIESVKKDLVFNMIQNEANYEQPLLLAHTLGLEKDRQLMECFRDRPFYLFRANPFWAALGLGSGELTLLRE